MFNRCKPFFVLLVVCVLAGCGGSGTKGKHSDLDKPKSAAPKQ